MKYDEFIAEVQRTGRFDSRKSAEEAVRATLEALGRRIGPAGKPYMRYPLPAKFSLFFEEEKEEKFGLDKFFKIVAERGGVSSEEAEDSAGSVISVLQRTDEKNIEGMLASLTEDYRDFFQKSRKQHAMTE